MKLRKKFEEIEFVVPDKPAPYWLWQEHISRYVFASRFTRDKVVLDVACGAGYGSMFLAERDAQKVVAGDISRDAIEYARAHYRSHNLEVVRLDAAKLPFCDNSLDVIVSFETIEHLKEYENFLSECKRALKDKGLFICSTPNKEIHSPRTQKPSSIYHVKEFYIGEFYELLDKHFSDIVLYGQQFLSHEQKKLHYIMARGGKILPLFPLGEQFRNFITELIFHQNIRVKLETTALDENSDKRYEPTPLQNSLLTPTYIIAVSIHSP
ncbi:Ubiquinone biosynthesis O-methyltransferase [subsurface metagenome]